MHVGSMSILQLHSFATIKQNRLPSILSNVRLARSAVRRCKRAAEEQQHQRNVARRRLTGKQLDPFAMDLNFL